MKVAHVLQSQHPLLAKAEPKGQAQNKARTIDTMVFFSKSGSPEPTVLGRETGGAGAARGVGGRSRHTDTKRLSVQALALQLMIINAKIICNLSAPSLQHTRSAPLAAQTVLAARHSDTFWVDVRAFGGFSCVKGFG